MLILCSYAYLYYRRQKYSNLVPKLVADSQTDSLIIPSYKDDKMFKEMRRAFCREGDATFRQIAIYVLSIFHIQRPLNLRGPGASAPLSIQLQH